jgi:serine/threonine protein kinase
MEFMAGGTLNSWLHDGNNKYTPMNWFQGLALLTDISRGVKLLHDTSLLHGDLSSNNVLLTRDHTTAKISDFGTVQMIEK